MTRFARASGSKASNKKVVEESTPWSQLKEQLAEVKENTTEQDQEDETDWKSVLDVEKKIEENKNSVWCEFEDVSQESKKLKEKPKNQGAVQGKDSSKLFVSSKTNKNADVDSDDVTLTTSESRSDCSNSKDNNGKGKQGKRIYNFQCEELTEQSKLVDNEFKDSSPSSKEHKIIHKKKKGRDSLFKGAPDNEEASYSDEVIEDSTADQENNSSSVMGINTESKEIAAKQKNKNLAKRNSNVAFNKEKRHSNPYKRRKVDEGDVKLDINGEEIWVTRLDGFYIRKDDAERIKQLEKDLQMRGISNQEVRAVVKKERRNAEKALARQKKKVCFNCRKGGHTLSSCPKLLENGTQIIGNGLCYKCGSTEHTHFQCKVNTGQSYKFATCFVCKQEGHISRQCPDNPRGIYPTGGGCKLCGDVTHFRRECPKLQNKNSKVTVGIIGEDIETLGDPADAVPPKIPFKGEKKRKVIKFK